MQQAENEKMRSIRRQTFFQDFDPKCQSQADIWPKGRREVRESVTLQTGSNIQFVVNKIPSGCFELYFYPPTVANP